VKLFVRAHSFTDRYTSYWDGSRHEWSSLSGATVFTETEIETFKRIPIRESLAHPITGYHTYVNLDRGGDYYVPSHGEWQELPMAVRLRTPEEIHAELARRCDEDLADWEAA
jgi:hypothetical protein